MKSLFNGTASGWFPILSLTLFFTSLTTINFAQCGSGEQSVSFSASGSMETFVVPTGVTSIKITAVGADGGNSSSHSGGSGATVSGTYNVSAGATLEVYVGVAGQSSASSGGGGGASGVKIQGGATLLIAGGGGGASDMGTGGGAIGTTTGIGVGGGASPFGVSGAGGGNETNDGTDSVDFGNGISSGGKSNMNGGAGGSGNNGPDGGFGFAGGGEGGFIPDGQSAAGGGGGGGYRGGGGGFAVPNGETSRGTGGSSINSDGSGSRIDGITGGGNENSGSITICYTVSLPVELLSFKASANDQIVGLSWSTTSEINNSGFEVQRRSAQNDNWVTLSFIPGQGSSTQLTSYSWVDNSPLFSDNYYRLKQLDYDGAYVYSSIVHAAINLSSPKLSVYPIPAKDQLNFSISSSNQTVISVEIYNSLGQIVKTCSGQERSVDIHDLSKGVYYLAVSNGEERFINQFLKK